MSKVYVVTSGEYSDYGINAVFSTEELANAAVDVVNKDRKYDHARVEVYELDAVDFTVPGMTLYNVRMKLNGYVLSVNKATYLDFEFNVYPESSDGGHLVTTIASDSAEGAIKVANERRTAWILEHGAREGR